MHFSDDRFQAESGWYCHWQSVILNLLGKIGSAIDKIVAQAIWSPGLIEPCAMLFLALQ
jgi:hypothetical protein